MPDFSFLSKTFFHPDTTVGYFTEAYEIKQENLAALTEMNTWFAANPSLRLTSVGLPYVPTTEELMKMTQDVIDILETDGWTQGRFHSADNAHCLLGAASKAADTNAQMINAWSKAIASHFGWADTIIWNDDPVRTFEQVLTHLRDFLYELKGR